MSNIPAQVFTVEDMQRLSAFVRNMRFPITPARADDGREFYFLLTTREHMIQNITPGTTFQAVMFGNGRFCLFEIIGIDQLGNPASPTGSGWYY